MAGARPDPSSLGWDFTQAWARGCGSQQLTPLQAQAGATHQSPTHLPGECCFPGSSYKSQLMVLSSWTGFKAIKHLCGTHLPGGDG